jgi:hypothetical protein
VSVLKYYKYIYIVYIYVTTRLTTAYFCANALAQKPPKRHKSPPMATDLWLNQCLTCGTNNPTPAKHKPKACSGCGQQLVTSTATWEDLNGRQKIFDGSRIAALKKWKATGGKVSRA